MKQLLNGLKLQGLAACDKVCVVWFFISLIALCGAGESVMAAVILVTNFAAAGWQIRKVDISKCEWLNDEEA